VPALDVVLNQLHRLGDREKGVRFEQLCAWLLESDPGFPVRRAYSWSKWREHRLTRTGVKDVGGDTGIDIVAETDSGELWAVQAKCYRESTRVSTDDIDSFIARSATSEFSHLLLIASTDKIAAVGRRKLLEARNPDASVVLLEDLRALERMDWPGVGEHVRPAVRRPNVMRAHQIGAVRDVVERGFLVARGVDTDGEPSAATDRGQLLMACGTGKTLVGQRVAEKLRAERTLVVVPSLSLLEQTHRAWKADATRRFDAFCFCSDPTVVNRAADETDRDVDTIAVPVHTKPQQLAEFLAVTDRRLVVFATYQSLERLTEVFSDPHGAGPFDLLIADEAHRSAGWAGSSFGLVCDAERLPAKRRLFMTATARVVTGSGDADLVLSMDDASRYGPVFHHLRFSDAIEQGLLCNYQVLVIAADPGEELALVQSRQFVSTPEHPSAAADALAIQLAVARAMGRESLRRVLSFHSRVKGAKTFASELPATVRWLGQPDGVLWTQAVSGAMPAGHRRMFLRRLERLDGCDRALLSNARCFGEGVDVPAIDGVVFVDPRESVVDIVQALGRTMRRSPETGKQRGTIVLPVVLNADSNADAALSSSAFATVWKVLRALRSHDDRLDDELRALLQARARDRSTGGTVPRVSFELPSIAVDRSFADAFTVRAVNVTADAFDRGLMELAAYVEASGHARVMHHHRTPTSFALGAWCSERREQRKEGRLSAERVAALDALGFVWDPLQHDFDRGLAALAAYVDENGDARVPGGYRTSTGLALGTWCGVRRREFNQGRLTAKRVAALDALGFDWDPLQEDFDRGQAELATYVDEKGDARVPADYKTSTGFRLGAWCAVRRTQRKGGKLSLERIAALDALGFTWAPFEEAFHSGLAELAAYVEAHGDAGVPKRYTSPTGFRLGPWCVSRRNDLKAGRLTAERVAALDALGFVWDPLQETFEAGLAELATYVRQHGDALVPQRYKTPAGFELGKWCSLRRNDRRVGRLSAKRVAALDALGFVWDAIQVSFARGLTELSAYVEAHGDAHVPDGYKTPSGFNLGNWCANRRQDRKAGQIDLELVAELDALGFVWNPLQKVFEKGLAELAQYVKENGDARVPQKYKTPAGFALGTWCGSRRKDLNEGRLSPERVAALDALGFVWDQLQQEFERGLAELTTYVEQNGHARVPAGYKTPTDFNLGNWCGSRRKDRKDGRLTAERSAALDALGFSWDLLQQDFDRGLSELERYVEENGNARVQAAYKTSAGFALGTWCTVRREQRKEGRLSAERVAALDALGFFWDPLQQGFDTGLAELAAYVGKAGDARVPTKHVTATGFKLGTWCSARRQERREGRLSAERMAALDALGFVWDPLQLDFDRGLAELAQYVAQNGHARVPIKHLTATGFKLGMWCSVRRKEANRGRLSAERVAALDALGFVWALRDSR